MTLSYHFSIDPAEAARANRLLYGSRLLGWANWLVWPMLLGLALLYRMKGVAWSEMGFLWFAMAFLALIQLLSPIVQRGAIRRELNSNASLRAEHHFTLNDDGIAITGGPGHFELNWSGVINFRETREFFLFQTGRRTGAFLPKRAVGAEQGVAELRAFLDSVVRPRLSATPSAAAT